MMQQEECRIEEAAADGYETQVSGGDSGQNKTKCERCCTAVYRKQSL
jgi:hypothetical protein